MWSRINFKTRAKQSLALSYWAGFAVCLIFSILSGVGKVSVNWTTKNHRDDWRQLIDWMFASGLLTWIFSSAVLFLALKIFVVNPLSVGVKNFYIKNANGAAEAGDMLSPFSRTYGGTVWTVLSTEIITFLWFLLLIVPGIIKVYEYRLVPYLLAERPELSGAEARRISSLMTNGYKMKIFILDISFIGWWLLGALACGVGVFFVAPYFEATGAQMYAELKEIAAAKETDTL